jgi:hypothetical protein
MADTFETRKSSPEEVSTSPELISKFQEAQQLIKGKSLKMDLVNPPIRFSDDMIALDKRNL